MTTLRQAFDSLNLAYFDGAVQATVAWGRGTAGPRKSIIFGWCYWEESRIVMSPLLAHPDVPFYYLGRFLFHEMLHLTHPPIKVGRREIHHHPAFLEAERRYLHLAEADEWEKANLKWLIAVDCRLTAYPRS